LVFQWIVAEFVLLRVGLVVVATIAVCGANSLALPLLCVVFGLSRFLGGITLIE